MRNLRYQFELIRAIRKFFESKDFLDVLTPPIVENPGMEIHIHPFQIFHTKDNKLSHKYLHTSPEFYMKELLASDEDFEKIFTLSYSFRDEPSSQIHRNQFLMLEWYRKNSFYTQIMDDTEDLIKFCSQKLKEKNAPIKEPIKNFQRATVQEIFQEILTIDILDFLDKNDLKQKIKKDFKDVILPDVECEWDDYFFLLFLNKVESALVNFPYLLLYEYPAPLAALSTLKKDDPRVCERFEVYMSGIELCNCFNELVDPIEQNKRFMFARDEKKKLYNYELPWPKSFMNTLEKGLPASAGIALGVERLLYALIKIDNPFFTEENS